MENQEKVTYKKSKRKKSKKPYLVEYKFKIPFFSSGWGVWGRYRTEDSRDKAFKDLSKKEGSIIIFRKVNET